MTKDEIKTEIIMKLIYSYFEARKFLESSMGEIFDFEEASEEIKQGFCAGIQSCAMSIDNTMDKPILSELIVKDSLDS